tara:strand:- start:88 stop:894 length:807 start_codon:yes stop_codon:yes gene_type:complete
MGENLNALTGSASAQDIVGDTVAEQSGEPVVEQEMSMEQGQEMEQQVADTNVSDEGADDWKSEAKKFQSLYDKTKSDLDKAMPIINTLNSRPDIVKAVGTMLTSENGEPNGKSSQNEVNVDDYDPWDAEYKPDSGSYKQRQGRINQEVRQQVEKELGAMKQEQAIGNLKSQVKTDYNMNDAEASDFIEFVTKPRADHTIDDLQQVWKHTRQKEVGANKSSQNIEATRKTQQQPMPAGVLQGGEPRRKTSEQDIIDSVVATAQKSRTQW